MANDLTTNPWLLDTANTTAKIWPARIKVLIVEWKDPINIGDKFIIQDINGRIVLDGTCEVALQSQIFRTVDIVNGMILNRLDSGVIRVHIR